MFGVVSRFTLHLSITVFVPIFAMGATNPPSQPDKFRKGVWGDAIEGQSLLITSTKDTYAPGERIVLDVAFKNVGQENVRALKIAPLAAYEITVLLPDGNHAPFTLFGQRSLEGSKDGSRSLAQLTSGDQLSAEFELSRIFDMTLSGKYKVFVQRKVWKDGAISRSLKATSNTFEITVGQLREKPVQRNLPSGRSER